MRPKVLREGNSRLETETMINHKLHQIIAGREKHSIDIVAIQEHRLHVNKTDGKSAKEELQRLKWLDTYTHRLKCFVSWSRLPV